MGSHKLIDGGSAWLTVVGAGILQAVVSCNMSAYALLLVEFSEVFQISKAVGGWGGSLYLALQDFCGIGMGILVHKYGCRPVTMICALITGVALFLTAFTLNIYMVYVTFALAGIGSSGMFLTSIVSVQQSFVKKRSIAMGLSLSIASVAVFIFMPCYRYLIMYYGWRGALFIHAGFSLQGVVAGAMILPIPAFYKARMLLATQKTTEPAETFDDEASFAELEDMNSNDQHKSVGTGHTQKTEVTYSVVKPLTVPVVPGYRMLLRDKDFWLFMFGRALAFFGAIVMFQQSSSRAVFKGMTKMEAALLPAAIGIGSTVSRISMGFIANMSCTNRTVHLTLSNMGAALVLAASCLTDNFYGSIIFTALFGFSFGSVMVTTPTVMVDLFGAPSAPKAQGLVQTATGFVDLIALPFTGLLFDITGNYDIPFYVAAAVEGVAGLFMFSIFITNRPRTRR